MGNLGSLVSAFILHRHESLIDLHQRNSRAGDMRHCPPIPSRPLLLKCLALRLLVYPIRQSVPEYQQTVVTGRAIDVCKVEKQK